MNYLIFLQFKSKLIYLKIIKYKYKYNYIKNKILQKICLA